MNKKQPTPGVTVKPVHNTKTYHYDIVSRYLYILGRDRLAFIVGLQGAFGAKEFYTKDSVKILLACPAR